MFWIVLCLAALAALIGVHALIRQAAAGLSATNLSDRFPWGLYIQGFLSLASLAGGLLFIAGASGLIAGNATLAVPAGALALGCLAGGGIMLLADLGKPLRSALLVLGKNPHSAMTWDFFTFGLCGLLALAAIIMGIAGFVPGTVWSLLTVIFAAAFLLVHVLLLLARQGNPISRPFLALEIITRGLWGGAALLVLIDLGLGAGSGASRIFLLTALSAALAHIVARFSLSRPENAGLASCLGRLSLADVVVVILLLLGIYGDVEALTAIAALGALAAFAWEKAHVVRELQFGAVLRAPYSQWQGEQSYKPAAMELRICLGGVGLAILVAQVAWLLITR